MKLILTHGYPFPYPLDPVDATADAIGESAAGFRLELNGVGMVQFMHTVTVDFKDAAAFDAAQKATGWAEWSPLVLEARFVGDGVAPSAGGSRGYGSGVELIVPALAYDGIVQAPSTSFCNVVTFED